VSIDKQLSGIVKTQSKASRGLLVKKPTAVKLPYCISAGRSE
jgi:hypothetical protein